MEQQCTHHWKQFGHVNAPFYCIKCGDSKIMTTSFEAVMEQREGGMFTQSSPRPLFEESISQLVHSMNG